MKSFDHQSAEDDLPFFGAVKNSLCISKVGFALMHMLVPVPKECYGHQHMDGLGHGSC